MLYPRWLETSRIHANRIALFDGGNGESWTFGQLARLVAEAPRAEGVVVARSGSIQFLIDVLRAWRDGVAVMPVERDAAEPELHSTPPEGTALVKHTPGAAGIPRGIFFRDEQVEADADRLVEAMGLCPERPNLGVVSLSHSYGFCNVVLPLLLHGVPMDWLPLPFPHLLKAAFERNESLVLPAVPSIWRAWHRSGVLKGAPIALAVSAGAPLSLELERVVFADAGLKIRNFYGASECGGIAYDRSEEPRETAEEVGRLLPGVKVERDEAGRLRVTSDAVSIGYDELREGEAPLAGSYLTHDLGEVDESGRVRLLGTVGGAINVAGRKISPAKVEAALLATGMVSSAKVWGVPSQDPERVEEVGARVQLRDEVGLDALKRAASSRLAVWEMPRVWEER